MNEDGRRRREEGRRMEGRAVMEWTECCCVKWRVVESAPAPRLASLVVLLVCVVCHPRCDMCECVNGGNRPAERRRVAPWYLSRRSGVGTSAGGTCSQPPVRRIEHVPPGRRERSTTAALPRVARREKCPDARSARSKYPHHSGIASMTKLVASGASQASIHACDRAPHHN